MSAEELARAEMRELEQLLVRLGFNPGLVDGVADARTTAAIESYQEFAALRVDGVASPALLEELRGVAESLGVAVKSAPAVAASPSDTTKMDLAEPGTSETVESETPPPTGEVTGQVAGAPWGMAVHLASFKQESKAHTEWQRLQQRLPNLFGDMESRIAAFDLGAEGLFFRLYAGPFPNLATAQDFCVTVSLEGFRCAIARGAAPQIAATSPATPDATSEPESPEAPPAERTETAAGTETAAVSQEPPSDVPAIAEPEAFEAPPSPEESPAEEPPVAAEPPEAQKDVAVAPVPEADLDPSPSVPPPAEPGEETGTATAAPTALLTAEQMGAAPPESAPEGGSEDATEAVAEDRPEDVTGDSAEDLAEAGPSEAGPSEAGAGGPMLLIAATRFAAATPDRESDATAEEPPREASIGSPTLLATMFDFGVETEEPNEAGESEAGESPRAENGQTGAAAAGGETGEVAAPLPSEEAEPGAPQTAAAAATGAEDYMKATAAFQIGDCATALRHYDQAFERGGLPREALASAHNNRGRCRYSLGQYDQALADFDRAIGLDRYFAAAYYNRGRVHTAMGHSAQARADLKSAYDLGFGRLQAQE